MTQTKPKLKVLACAIYTRKSSDEGLDQTFNSLDAQRESGEAYVKSQAAEGWKLVPTRYDDGGYSGGTMERPGLQRLLTDIDAGRIDVVVVYKIDRLTRSLADFTRIVEAFDARNASFVSVTQSFNTTSSMGRLTLNVLLSFAQFEREVTGERIRDKIAASKAKGMWMGGVPPLGYDLPAPGSRKLLVNTAEAETVGYIFARYLALGSVHRLAEELAAQDIRSKQRTTAAGRVTGGAPFSRGALFHMLRSRIYLGKITHKDQIYEGEHDAIIGTPLFDQVQAALNEQTRRRANTPARMGAALLTGRLFDATGEPMSPTHAQGRSGKRYRYYVSAPLQQGLRRDPGTSLSPQRVSADAIESVLDNTLARLFPDHARPIDQVKRVELQRDRIVLTLPAKLAASISAQLGDDEIIVRDSENHKTCRLTLPILIGTRGARTMITTGAAPLARQDKTLISALRRAHIVVGRDAHGPFLASAPSSQYARRLAGLDLLAPCIQRDILAGKQPPSLTLAALIARELPLHWDEQRSVLGWPA
jgi:DNA invertase Pin-like site-specific DNA recombinase